MADALAVVRPAISKTGLQHGASRQTQNVLLQEDGGRLKLTCTNLEVAVSTWVDGQVEKKAMCSVPVTILDDLVKALPNGEVILDINEDPQGLTVECQNNRSQINGYDPKDFPPIPTINTDEPFYDFDAKQFGTILRHVLPAVSKVDSRPVLTGVKLDLADSAYTMAAADGFRLTVDNGDLGKALDKTFGMIVLGTTLNLIERLLQRSGGTVRIANSGAQKQVLFNLQDIEVVTSLLDGDFPDYQKLLPTSWKSRLVMPLVQLKRAVRAAVVFVQTSAGGGIIRLTADMNAGRGLLTITSQADEIGEAKSEVEITLEGEPIKIAFNHQFLTDVLNTFDDGNENAELVLETASASSPGLFSSSSIPNYKHVVMPMFVQW